MNINEKLLRDFSKPRCDKDGYYKPVQCNLLGGCRCVDKYGKRTSRSSREAPLPDCEKLANTGVTRDTNPSPTRSPTTQSTIRRTTQPATKNSQPTSLEPPCWKRVREQNRKFGPRRRPEDLYTPRCDKHGFYKPLQCPPLTGCYCVDKYGNPTSGSRRGPFRPNCRNILASDLGGGLN